MTHESGALSETSPKIDFSDFNICEALKKGVQELGYLKPTDFQKEVFEHFINGENVVGEGQSSYGKSLAFSLPILSKISVAENGPQALIICESFAQSDLVMKECRALGRHLKVSVDNANMAENWQEKVPQIIVGTAEDLPKIKDLFNNSLRTIFFDNLSSANTQKAIEILSPILNDSLQIMVFGSETLSVFKNNAGDLIEKAANIQNSDQPKAVAAAKHIVHQAKGDEPKPRALLASLLLHNKKGALVTCNEASEVELLARYLTRYGFKTVSSSEEQNRSAVADNLNMLASGKVDVFICQNNLLGSSLSLSAISLMINFDMIERPQVYENITQFNSQANGVQRTIVNLLSSREHSFLGPIKAQCLIDFSEQDLPSGDEVLQLAAKRIVALLNKEAESIELGQFESLAEEISKSENCVSAIALLLRNHLLNQSVKAVEAERAPRERMSNDRRPFERRDERAPRSRQAQAHSHTREESRPREENRAHEEPERKSSNTSENDLDGSARLYVTLGRQDGLEDLASLAQYLSNNSGVDLGHFSGAGMLRDHSAHIEVDSDVADAIIKAIHGSARPNAQAPAAEGEAANNSVVCERAKLNTERKYSRPPQRRGGYQRRR